MSCLSPLSSLLSSCSQFPSPAKLSSCFWTLSSLLPLLYYCPWFNWFSSVSCSNWTIWTPSEASKFFDFRFGSLCLSSSLMLGDVSKHESDHSTLPCKILPWLPIACRIQSQLFGMICTAICDLILGSVCSAFIYQSSPSPSHFNHKEELVGCWVAQLV